MRNMSRSLALSMLVAVHVALSALGCGSVSDSATDGGPLWGCPTTSTGECWTSLVMWNGELGRQGVVGRQHDQNPDEPGIQLELGVALCGDLSVAGPVTLLCNGEAYLTEERAGVHRGTVTINPFVDTALIQATSGTCEVDGFQTVVEWH